MGVGKAIVGLFRLVGALIAGTFQAITGWGNKSRVVIKAKYENIIATNEASLKEMDTGVAEKRAAIKRKTAKLETLKTALADKMTLKTGAVNYIKSVASKFSSEAELKKSEEYIVANDKFNTLKGKVEEIEKQIKDLSDDIAEDEKTYALYKSKLVKMQGDLKALREEKRDTVTDMAWAEHEKKINDRMRGTNTDWADEELAQLREQRDTVIAAAETSAELAGTDSDAVEDQFRKFATVEDNEFSNLLNLSDMFGGEKKAEEAPAAEAEAAGLPE